MEAYISGLEEYAELPGSDLSKVASVASFFISRVDTEIDRRLDAIGSPEALALRGKGAVAQGKLAYQLFQDTFSGPRWAHLAQRGAKVQRPLWASTSTKNPAYPDTLYVDELIGPDTVNTLPDATIEAFADHGTLARRVDADVDEAEAVWQGLQDVGIDIDDVADVLERGGRHQLPEELRRAPRRPDAPRPPSSRASSGSPTSKQRIARDASVVIRDVRTTGVRRDGAAWVPRKLPPGAAAARAPASPRREGAAKARRQPSEASRDHQERRCAGRTSAGPSRTAAMDRSIRGDRSASCAPASPSKGQVPVFPRACAF